MTTPDTKSTVLLQHHLTALKLATVASECEKVIHGPLPVTA